MPTLFQLNGSVRLHFFQLESELKHLYTVISTENFNTLFLFCYLLIPPRTAGVGHSTARPGIGGNVTEYYFGHLNENLT
jgi:hypothetical protein